jgi:hypothetical protein
MPISLAQIFVLAMVLVVWLLSRRSRCGHGKAGAMVREERGVEPELVRAQAVVPLRAAPVQESQPLSVVAAVNVMGRGALFRCQTVRRQDGTYETLVCLIDRRGRPLSQPYTYRESLQEIMAEFIHLGV